MELVEFRRVVPDAAEKTAAVREGETRGELHGLDPVDAREELHPGPGGEVLLQVFLEVLHIIGGDFPAGRAGFLLELAQKFDDGFLIRDFLVIAVRIVGVGEDLHEVHLGKETEPDGMPFADAFRRRGGEARDQSGGFLAALGVDLTDKVHGFAAEVGAEFAFPVSGQGGDKVALAGLARTEDAHAHLARSGA